MKTTFLRSELLLGFNYCGPHKDYVLSSFKLTLLDGAREFIPREPDSLQYLPIMPMSQHQLPSFSPPLIIKVLLIHSK